MTGPRPRAGGGVGVACGDVGVVGVGRAAGVDVCGGKDATCGGGGVEAGGDCGAGICGAVVTFADGPGVASGAEGEEPPSPAGLRGTGRFCASESGLGLGAGGARLAGGATAAGRIRPGCNVRGADGCSGIGSAGGGGKFQVMAALIGLGSGA